MKLGSLNHINKLLAKISPFKIKTDSKHEMLCNNINYDLLKNIYGKDALLEKRFLNFGAGYRFKHFAFKNIDNYKGDIDLQWSPCDMRPINIKNQSIKVIYTSHMIEHLTFDEAKFMLKEFYRILEPDGQLRIIAPDIDIFHEAYLANDPIIFNKNFTIDQAYVSVFAARLVKGYNDFKPTITPEEIKSLFKNKNRIDVYNDLISRVDAKSDRKDWYNHISWWNFDRFKKVLDETGFSSVSKSGYSQSKSLILRDIKYFDQTAPWYSVYVDASK